ncbi:MAG: hypothetical protein KKB30_08735 [Proteobacteria bacterium]|nr:hypothetical protein [Pseudomonadota bacterium]MBU1716892.1 hypothetical protein [Pseudomonadota bacterium]
MITVKRTIIAALATAALALPATVFALGGPCSGCHTMHNSQDGASVGGVAYTTGNNQLLLANNCVGCHAHNADPNTATGYSSGANGPAAPQVNDIANPLAGGYFSNTSNQTHNVADLIAVSKQSNDGTLTVSPGGAVAANTLSCSGALGCHNAVGAHHSNANTVLNTVGTTNGGSYRFLEVQGSAVFVDGTEGINYGYDAAEVVGSSRYSADITNGMGAAVCGVCHGNFHGSSNQLSVAGAGSAQIWKRHPTDIPVNANLTGEAYNDANGGVYNPAIPLGEMTNTNTTTGQVICLSCHMSHGSAYPDLLRWNLANMNAGTTLAAFPGDDTVGSAEAGCFICHTSK